jgi:hypothetical protein
MAVDFILEGIASCVIAVIAFFAVANFPEDAKWLNESERAFLIERLKQEQGESKLEEATSFKGVPQSFSDVKNIVAGFMYFGPTMAGYSKRSLVQTSSQSKIELDFLHRKQVWPISSRSLCLPTATVRLNHSCTQYRHGRLLLA